ncbi:MAG: cardiolipin synthase ClsB, partial [Rhodocyclaceae bacterium]
MKAEFLPGNALDLLETGRDFFPALIAAIDAAQREFHLETYIFEDDASGRAVAAALCRAARRGVAV